MPADLERIASFSVDHDKLFPGLYLSRSDVFGPTTISTFDIRVKTPNTEPPLDVPALHTMEHLGATFLRNHPVYKDRVVYFGPMGCRTGLYLVVEGMLTSRDVVPLITELFQFMAAFEGDIPGTASSKECGNYLEQNLTLAKYEAKRYLNEVIQHFSDATLNYPE